MSVLEVAAVAAATAVGEVSMAAMLVGAAVATTLVARAAAGGEVSMVAAAEAVEKEWEAAAPHSQEAMAQTEPHAEALARMPCISISHSTGNRSSAGTRHSRMRTCPTSSLKPRCKSREGLHPSRHQTQRHIG
jgi:hypothetical protein